MLSRLDDTDPFEIDRQAAHLFKHDPYGIDDIYEIWNSDPLFYPAKPPAHWLMVAEIAGEVLMVPLAPVRPRRPDPMPTDRLLPRRQAPRGPIQGGPMTTKKMTRQEEHDFYADPDNQTPQGPARRRNSKLTELVPVRFPPETLAKIRDAADADDRSVSAWIRRAVDRELEQTSKTA
jgi:hypothetical protein